MREGLVSGNRAEAMGSRREDWRKRLAERSACGVDLRLGVVRRCGTWTISNVTFPSGTGYLAVKQSSGSYAVFGPGRPTKGLHLINWREVY